MRSIFSFLCIIFPLFGAYEIEEITTREGVAEIYPLWRELYDDSDMTQSEFVKNTFENLDEISHCICIRVDGVIRAIAEYDVYEEGYLYLSTLITDAAYRNHGFGTALLEYVLDHARAAQCLEVHLHSLDYMHDAHRLYQNHGFRIIAHHFKLDLMNAE